MPDVKVTITGDASQLKNTLGGLKGSFTELNSMLSVVKQGAQVLGQAFDATVGSTMKLGQSVEDMSRMIGATAEQSSRLIAVSNMLGMSQESVSQAMLGAIRKGYAPTIDGLSKISDAYLAIQDPVGRTKYLLDTFGRSGAAMGELMEKGSAGIRALGDAADRTGTIMSQNTVDAAKKLGVELNTLKLTAQGVGVAVGTALIPTLTAAATSGLQITQVWNLMRQAVTDGVATQLQMNAAVVAFVSGNPAMLQAILQQDNAFRGASQSANDVGTAIRNIPTEHTTVLTTILQTIQGGGGLTGGGYAINPGTGQYINPGHGAQSAVQPGMPITQNPTHGIASAIGGPLGSGVHLVGEEGPELIVNGTVLRASVTRMLSKGIASMGHALDAGGGGGSGGATGSQLLKQGNWSGFQNWGPSLSPGAVMPGQPPLNPRDYGYGGGGGGSTSTVVSQAAAAAAAAATAASGPAVAQATREAQAQVTALQAKLDLSNAKNTRALEKIADILMQQGTYQDLGRAVGAANMLLDIGY